MYQIYFQDTQCRVMQYMSASKCGASAHVSYSARNHAGAVAPRGDTPLAPCIKWTRVRRFFKGYGMLNWFEEQNQHTHGSEGEGEEKAAGYNARNAIGPYTYTVTRAEGSHSCA